MGVRDVSGQILDSSRGIGMVRGVGDGRVMEGPGRLRRKAATPVPMGVVRDSGCSTSKPALRQPRASEKMWWRRAMGSRWGGLDHQKRSTTLRDGSVDP